MVKKKSKSNNLDNSLKLIVKTSFVVFIGIFLSKIFTYAYRIIIARQFGPEVYGLFSLSLVIVSWFASAFSLGLSEGLLRYISLYRGKKEIDKIRHIFRIVLIITFFSGIISAFLLFIFSDVIALNFFKDPQLALFIKVLSITVPLSMLLGVFLSTLRAFEKIPTYSFLVNILQNLIKLLAIILFIYLGINANNSVTFSYLLSILITLIVAYILCKYYLSEVFENYQLKKNIRDKITKDLISYSWPVMFFGVILSLYYWTDSIMLGYFYDAQTVGFYNAAIPIVALLIVVPDLISQLFFPLITKEYSKGKVDMIIPLTKQVTKWVFIINLPIFLLLTIFPGAAINILFGKEYLSATEALRILAGVGFLSGFVSIFMSLISMIGRPKLILRNTIITLSINLVLNFILIPKYGLAGAATATLASWVVFFSLFLFQIKKYLKFFPFGLIFLKITVMLALPAVLLIYLKSIIIINIFSLVILSTIFFLSYLALVFFTGCLNKNDLMILKSLRDKIIYLKETYLLS